MARLVEQESFFGLTAESGTVVEDLLIRDSVFESCGAVTASDPSDRPRLSHIQLESCRARNCVLGAAQIENVVLDGLQTHGQLLQVWGASFSRVRLCGDIERVMLTGHLGMRGFENPSLQDAYDRANREVYRAVDWALDISEARFDEVDIRGVPGRLILRDPHSQLVMSRSQAEEFQRDPLRLLSPLWGISISEFLSEGRDDDLLLVAPKASGSYEADMDDLDRLRAEGLAS